MVQDIEKQAIPINYRRAVNSRQWEQLAFLAIKLKMTPNEVIDHIVFKEYLAKKGKQNV